MKKSEVIIWVAPQWSDHDGAFGIVSKENLYGYVSKKFPFVIRPDLVDFFTEYDPKADMTVGTPIRYATPVELAKFKCDGTI